MAGPKHKVTQKQVNKTTWIRLADLSYQLAVKASYNSPTHRYKVVLVSALERKIVNRIYLNKIFIKMGLTFG